jgi:cytochrome c-type biogenesis protein
MPAPRAIRRGHPLGSFFLGVSFAVGWTPCVGPILGTVLTLVATEGSALSGLWYLTLFSLGLAVPFLLIAAFLGAGAKLVRRATPFLNTVSLVGGLALVVVGILLLSNRMAYLTSWGSNLMPGFYESLTNYF